MRVKGVWLLLVVLGGIAPCGAAQPNCMWDTSLHLGTLKSRTNHHRVGGMASYTCLLNDDLPGLHASNVTFLMGGVPVSSNNIRILDDHRARLKYDGLEEKHNMYNVVCCVLLERPGGEFKRLMVDVSVISVGYPPFQPEIKQYEIQNWQRLFVHWETHRNNTVYFTNYTLHWNDSEGREGTSMMKHQMELQYRCVVELEQPLASSYTVLVTGSNELGNVTSQQVTFKQRGRVRPDRVLDTEILDVTSFSANVTWQAPARDRDLFYRLTLFSKWSPRYVDIMPGTKQLFMARLLKSLTPHTTYQVSLVAYTEFHTNLSSQAVEVSFTTKMAVPATAPRVTPGCYEELSSSSEVYKDIRLYWQNIPEREQNGEITAYNITYQHQEHPMLVQFPQCWKKVTNLLSNTTYQFFITAINQVGTNQSLSLRPITVTSRTQLYRDLKNITASVLSDGRVLVTWAFDEWIHNVTLFYCKATHEVCQEEMKWRHLTSTEAREGKVVQNIESRTLDVKIGLSASGDMGARPIKWAGCLHDATQVASTPKVEVTEEDKDSLVLSLHTPACERTAYVYAYRLLICADLPDPPEDNIHQRAYPCQERMVADMPTIHVVDGLKPDTSYTIKAWSMSMAGQSSSWTEVKAQTLPHTVSDDTGGDNRMLVLGVVAAVCIPLAIIGICGVCRFMKKRYIRTVDIPVKMPDQGPGAHHKYNDYIAVNNMDRPIGTVHPEVIRDPAMPIQYESSLTMDEYAAASEGEEFNGFGKIDDSIDSGHDTDDDVAATYEFSGGAVRVNDANDQKETVMQSLQFPLGLGIVHFNADGHQLNANICTDNVQEPMMHMLPIISSSDSGQATEEAAGDDDIIPSYLLAGEYNQDAETDVYPQHPDYRTGEYDCTSSSNRQHQNENHIDAYPVFVDDVLHGDLSDAEYGCPVNSEYSLSEVLEQCEDRDYEQTPAERSIPVFQQSVANILPGAQSGVCIQSGTQFADFTHTGGVATDSDCRDGIICPSVLVQPVDGSRYSPQSHLPPLNMAGSVLPGVNQPASEQLKAAPLTVAQTHNLSAGILPSLETEQQTLLPPAHSETHTILFSDLGRAAAGNEECNFDNSSFSARDQFAPQSDDGIDSYTMALESESEEEDTNYF